MHHPFKILLDNKEEIIKISKEKIALPINDIKKLSTLEGKEFILYVIYKYHNVYSFEKIIQEFTGYHYDWIRDGYKFIIKENKKSLKGLYNNKLEEIFPIEYDNIEIFTDDSVALTKGELASLVDINGNVIIPFETYDYIEKVKDINVDLCYVGNSDNYGVIDTKNNIIVPKKYNIINYKNGFIVAEDFKYRMNLYDKSGKILIKNQVYIEVQKNHIKTIDKNGTTIYDEQCNLLLSNVNITRLNDDFGNGDNYYVYEKNKAKGNKRFGLIYTSKSEEYLYVLTEDIYENFETLNIKDDIAYLVCNLPDKFSILEFGYGKKISKVDIDGVFLNSHMVESCYNTMFEVYFSKDDEVYVYLSDSKEIIKYSECFNN